MCLWVLSYLRPCLLAAKQQGEQDPYISETGSVYTLNGYPFVYGHVFLPAKACTSGTESRHVFGRQLACFQYVSQWRTSEAVPELSLQHRPVP
jgi:hypothetical protein